MGTLAVIGIVTVGITGVRSLQAGRTSLTSPITKIAKQRAATPLYVPRSLPGGYSLVDNTIPQPSESVVIYTIQNQNGHNLYVSQQKQPSSFDFAAFNNSFTNRKVYKLSLGTLTIGEVGSGQIVASLPTGKTWIILNTNKGISYQDILEIFKNLHLDKV